MAERRKIGSYIRVDRFKNRKHLYIFFLSLLFLCVFELLAIRMLRDIGAQIAALPDTGVAMGPIYSSLNVAAMFFFATFLVYVLFAVYFVLYVEKRVIGASVGVLGYIKELIRGNYSQKRKLRKGEELEEIMEALHELADRLRDSK